MKNIIKSLTEATYLSKIAYDYQNIKTKNKLALLRYKVLKFGDVDETQYMIVEDDSKVVVAFRGTEADKIKDWMTDLKIVKVAVPGDGEAHLGFYQATIKVLPDIAPILRTVKKPIYITGHSMGADLALMCGYLLHYVSRIDVAGVYAIEPARPGDDLFKHAYDSVLKDKTYCVMNHRDIVPRMPPRVLGYTHVGQSVYIDADGEINFGWGRWRIELDRITQGRIEALFEAGIDDFEDHKVDKVLRALAQGRMG